MRKVIFTESQIQRLVEDGFGGSYLPDSGKDGKEPFNASEIGTRDKDINGDRKAGPTGDKVGNIKCVNNSPYGTYRAKHAYVRPLEEQNSNLKRSNIIIPDRIKQQLGDGKREDNIRNSKSMSVNTADKVVHDLKDSKESGDILLVKTLKDQLKNKRANDKTIRKSMPENGFIKKHEKKGTGTAHTEKPEFTFTYEY